jgi:hypothetical protein
MEALIGMGHGCPAIRVKFGQWGWNYHTLLEIGIIILPKQASSISYSHKLTNLFPCDHVNLKNPKITITKI